MGDPLVADLQSVLGAEQVAARPIDLAAYASDASLYRIVPRVVVRPRSLRDVQSLFALSRQHGVPLTFRAAGTSLSGQALTDGILADLSRGWRRIEVLDEGRRVRVEPGVIGAQVNARLRPFGRKIGPDPASIQACMMGGILANNSSGMCCGVAQNAYHTLDSLQLVLPSGTVVDTAAPDARERLRRDEPALMAGLNALRMEIGGNARLRDRIRAKYRSKNTTGYSLNAFLDYDQPLEILRHLVIGSEGTLAFIAQAVLHTVPDWPVKYTGLLLFPGIAEACRAIVPLKDAGAVALEVMDRAALRSVESQPGIPPEIRMLGAGAAGLLVEFHAEGESSRPALEHAASRVVSSLRLAAAPRFTHDTFEQAALWKVRQGMFPSVGSARASGTAVIIEDVAFPVERLAEAVSDLRQLLDGHRYPDAIIFGHAKDGNLHFVLTPSFNDAASIAQYAALMDDVVRLVVERYDGALKAEHGTGRNMAPFVETEWGPEAYAIMRRLKSLIDPNDLLNPGVIINADPQAHLAHLKTLPSVESEVDACIECGYCEPRCPSRDLTLTPRQRIVVRREMERSPESSATASRPAAARAALERDFPYEALDTCAADGLCAVACPVGIDTGSLTKRFRSVRTTPRGRRAARWIASHFAGSERAVRSGLSVAAIGRMVLRDRGLHLLSRLPNLMGIQTPRWTSPMPRPAARPPLTSAEGAAAVYFPSCISRTMGSLPDESSELSLMDAVVQLGGRAGLPLWIPDDATGHCCGVPFSSKGYREAHEMTVHRTIAAFWRWSDHGRLPVVVDTSPCTYGLRTCRSVLDPETRTRFDRLTILDAVEFAGAQLLPRLTVARRQRRVALHPVCSLVKMNLVSQLETVARACAEEVVIPNDAGCCGFAGDRGWLVPELTEAATRREAAEVRRVAADGHYSTSRTCEIGMTRATGEVYRSVLFLLEWATRVEVGD